MVENLFQEITDLINEGQSIPWNYYPHWVPRINVDTLFTKQGSISFIKDYFSAGAKKSPLFLNSFGENYNNEYIAKNIESTLSSNQFGIDRLSDDRAVHTVSAFFLGIFIESALFGNNHLTACVDGEDGFPFPYLWFLTSLYHDIGYQFEQDRDYHRSIKQLLGANYHHNNKVPGNSHILDTVYRNLDISIGFSRFNKAGRQDVSLSHALYTELLGYAKDTFHHPVQYSNGVVIRKSWYQSSLIHNYFDYRFLEMDVCDHGIIGGSLFLDRMIKNYVTTYTRACTHQRSIPNLNDFSAVDSGLRFSKHQLPIFDHIANCIKAHNVYKACESRTETYRAHGLDHLVGRSFNPICKEKDPLLYILSLSDTLDPVKIYRKSSGLSVADILHNTSFSFTPGTKSIMVSAGNAISIEPIYEAADSLKTWTAATTYNKTDNSFMMML